MSEVQIPVEVLHRPPGEMPALQGRMLLKSREFLNPNNTTDAPLLTKDSIATFEQREYDLFETATVRERKAHWQGKEGGFDVHYNEWSGSMVQMLNAEKNKQMMDPLKPLFAQIGVEGDVWNAQDVKHMYDRYLDNSSAGSGIKKFVTDVLTMCQKDGSFDMSVITQNRDSLVWLTQIFGEKSSQVIDQLLFAESALIANPEAYFAKVNTWINKVTEPETDLMKFLWNGEVSSTPTPADQEPKEGVYTTIEELRTPIQKALLDPDIDDIIVSASTGKGKTTIIPQFAYEILKPGEKIAVTQPRVVAVDKLTERIGELMEVEVGGEELGKQTGKGKEGTKDTHMMLVTDGIILQKLKHDPMLMEYKYIMIDEWHERHGITDETIAHIRIAQKLRRAARLPPLKLIITSATINSENLKNQLSDARVEVFNVAGGRKYNIDESHESPLSDPMSLKTAPLRAVKKAQEWAKTRPTNRHILIFMPGERTILETKALLKKMDLGDVTINTFYGDMNEKEKLEALDVKTDGKRHIIIASPLAQTSLTLDEDPDVISSGYVNLPRVDPKTGLYFLPEVKNSKDDIIQQEGRGGRNSNGLYHFCGTKAEFEALDTSHPAEILRSDLSEMMLRLKNLNVAMDEFPLIDKKDIPPENIERADRTLRELDALNPDGTFSDVGKSMAKYPLDVHGSRMMVEAERYDVQESVATIIAMSEQTSLFKRVGEDERDKLKKAKKDLEVYYTSDYLNLLNIYRGFQDCARAGKNTTEREILQREWCDKNYIRFDCMIKAAERRSKFMEQAKIHHIERNNSDTATLDNIQKCIFTGLKDGVMKKNGSHPNKEKQTIYTYSIKNEPVDKAVVDRDSVVNPIDFDYVVSAGNYPRQSGAEKGNVDIYMRLNQAVPASWVV